MSPGPLHRSRFERHVPIFLAATALISGSHIQAANLDVNGPCSGARPSIERVEEALDTGSWDLAEELIEPLTTTHAKCGRVIVDLARLRAARGDSAEAERLFARATAQVPGDPLAHARFAEFQLNRGLHFQAAHLISAALTLDPDCPEALVVQGQILAQTGQIREARLALDKAIEIDPSSAEAYYQLGVWFFQIHIFDQAARSFERSATLRPQMTRTHDYLALSLEMLGEADRAEAAYQTALKKHQGPFPDPSLDLNYGRFLLKQNRLVESRSHLDRAVESSPDRRGPRYERAKLNLAAEDYGAARKDAERVLSLPDKSGRVLDLQVFFLLATVHSRLGNTELAQKYAELSRSTQIPDQAADGRR